MTITTVTREAAPPLRMGAGQEIRREIDGEPVIFIGATNGAPVILSPPQWDVLRQWKLTRLTFSGVVRAGDGAYHTPAARFLMGIQYDNNRQILYRNGNALDLRPSNLIVVPRHQTTKETH